MTEVIHLRREGDTATITMNRPPLNVLDIATLDILGGYVEEVCLDSSVRFLIFGSEIDGVFSAGNDVADHTVERAPEMLKVFHRIFRSLLASDVVTLAQVDGVCLGGGAELALFCDFVCSSDRSQFGFPEIKVGCFPPVAAAVLPLWVGTPRARRWILTGETISLPALTEAGMIHRIVSTDDLAQAVEDTLNHLRNLSPDILRLSRRAISGDENLQILERLQEAEDVYINQILRTPDAAEGVAAFMEKRSPKWKDDHSTL